MKVKYSPEKDRKLSIIKFFNIHRILTFWSGVATMTYKKYLQFFQLSATSSSGVRQIGEWELSLAP